MVRNGHLPERTIQTGLGQVAVKAPWVHDRTGQVRFNSSLMPRYLRRSRSIEALLPWLYLKGTSSGEFSEAQAALRGADAPGLSAGTISRLKTVWLCNRKQIRLPPDLDGRDPERAYVAFDAFVQSYEPKYPKAAQCLAKDKNSLLTFDDFPAEHWHHIRTSYPIESTFASVRLRTATTRGCSIASKHSVIGIQTHQKRRAALAETAWT